MTRAVTCGTPFAKSQARGLGLAHDDGLACAALLCWGMRHEEFKIGVEFTTAGGLARWRCTDIGTRVIVAIEIVPGEDPSWYNGPPYQMS